MFRTYPLGSRPVSRGHQAFFWEPSRGHSFARLGQAAAPHKDPSNRLLDVDLMSILKRRTMAVIPVPFQQLLRENHNLSQLYGAGWPGKLVPGAKFYNSLNGQEMDVGTLLWEIMHDSGMPGEAIGALFGISQDPTSKEVDDAAKIDAFFGPGFGGISYPSLEKYGPSAMNWGDPLLTRPCLDGYFYAGLDYSQRGERLDEEIRKIEEGGPESRRAVKIDMPGGFWCSPWASGKVQVSLPEQILHPGYWTQMRHNIRFDSPGRGGLYGFTLNEKWGDVQQWYKNAVLADYVLSKYPFPQPFGFDRYIDFWMAFALPGLRGLVQSGALLAEEDIRVWITFSIIANYKDMVAELNQALKDLARDAKREALVRTVAFAVIAVFAAIVLAPEIAAIVAGIANSTASALNKFDAHDMQVQMGQIQDAFKASDPGFSDQVGEAAAYVARLSKALETAVDKSQVQRTLAAPSLSTGLMIGGGLAAIGALALAIFRK